MKLPLVAAVVCACALGGCSTLSSLVGGTAPPAQDAEKALAIAHLAYQAAGQSLVEAAQSGVLHGDDAAHAQVLYDQAGAALDIADQADAVTDAQSTATAVAGAETLLAEIGALIPKH